MCIILDNNISGEVFGNQKTEAGAAVWHWINGEDVKGKASTNMRLRVVTGGRLTKELIGNNVVRSWMILSSRRGNLMNYGASVDKKMREIDEWDLASDDPHIIALALVSDAKLLYSNDSDLHKDFGNPKIIKNGKIYSTKKNSRFDRKKRSLLEQCKCVG